MYSEKLKSLAVDEARIISRDETIELLREFCVADDLNRVKASDVYDLYCEFCKTKNITPPSPQDLGRSIAKTFLVTTKNVRFGKTIAKVYLTE